MTDQEMLQAMKDLLTPISEKLDRHDQRFDQADDRTDHLEDRMTRLELLIENQLVPALDALVEGQQLTHERLRDLTTREETDRLKDEIFVLKTAVAAHTREIEQLKKAL